MIIISHFFLYVYYTPITYRPGREEIPLLAISAHLNFIINILGVHSLYTIQILGM